MVEDWWLIEADFQRDYGIDLVTSFRTMSLRKFVALFYCLSADSLLVNKEANQSEKEAEEASFEDLDW